MDWAKITARRDEDVQSTICSDKDHRRFYVCFNAFLIASQLLFPPQRWSQLISSPSQIHNQCNLSCIWLVRNPSNHNFCAHYTPAQQSWRGGILDSPCPSVRLSVCPSVCRRHGFRSISQVLLWNFNFKFHMHVDGGHRQKPIDFQQCHFQNGCLAAILDFLVSGL